MSRILDNLPGIAMPVHEIPGHLRDMWKPEPGIPDTTPSDFRASQLNLVIQLGADTPEEEALDIFNAAIVFGQRHPCRVLLLCPNDPGQEDLFRAKLFTQCYIGQHHRDMCCCEVLLLSYTPGEPQLLFHQVSVWIESDLPTYHWFHRVPEPLVRNRHLSFVKASKRVLFDSAVDGSDLRDLPTPDPSRIRDLATARTLPFRQSIGQSLSLFAPSEIIDGLTSVELLSSPSLSAEASRLGEWIHRALTQSSRSAGLNTEWTVTPASNGGQSSSLSLRFLYNNTNLFTWSLAESRKHADLHCSFADRSVQHRLNIRMLDPTTTLAESIFYA